jgi:hypothetical protein
MLSPACAGAARFTVRVPPVVGSGMASKLRLSAIGEPAASVLTDDVEPISSSRSVRPVPRKSAPRTG